MPFRFFDYKIVLILILKYEKTSFRMFNYRLFCGYRPRKFVVTGQICITKKHLAEVHVQRPPAQGKTEASADRLLPLGKVFVGSQVNGRAHAKCYSPGT